MSTDKNAAQPAMHKLLILAIAAVVLSLVLLASVAIGTYKITMGDMFACLTRTCSDTMVNQIIGRIRLPRVLTGMLAGMNLSVAGVLLQGILRNPMASPNIIGVNAGAGLAAIIVMALLPQKTNLIPPAAFIGALLAFALIFLIAMGSGSHNSTVHIVLAGVAVSALLNAMTNGVMLIFSDILDVTFSWTLGSLSGRGWSSVANILPYSIIGIVLAFFLSPKLNLFSLGDEIAHSVGIKPGFFRFVFAILAAVLAGSAVSVAGTIGFVGLVAPHTARLLIGNDHRYLVPLSALFGSILLVLSDTVARSIFQPVELSVGIVTAVIGAPFFLVLLKRR